MKTIVKFNKNLERVNITTCDILAKATNSTLIQHLNEVEKYEAFCRAQTKHGQARKNERARARHTMFTVSMTEAAMTEYKEIKNNLFNERDAKIEKITVEITYDGRKKANLSRIMQGIQMAINIGGISPQYYGIGLKYFRILK